MEGLGHDTDHGGSLAATVRILAKLSELRGDDGARSESCHLFSRRSGGEESRELRALACDLGRLSGEVGAAVADASTATRPHPVKEPETSTTTATQVTQSSVPAVPATQSPSTDVPMETSETTTEPGRDLDVRMAERQPKRRRELEDVEMTSVLLAQPASDKTYEVCSILVHTDIADNNCSEEGLVNENTRGEIESENDGSNAAISVNNAANPDGWQPELLEKGTIVYGAQVRSTSS